MSRLISNKTPASPKELDEMDLIFSTATQKSDKREQQYH
jgi:hypothetical protein